MKGRRQRPALMSARGVFRFRVRFFIRYVGFLIKEAVTLASIVRLFAVGKTLTCGAGL